MSSSINHHSSAFFVNNYEEPLCQKTEILEKKIDIETGKEDLIIKVHSQDNGIPFTVSREEFVKKSFFNKLTLHGLSIIEDDDSYADLRSAINDSERQAPVVYYHESMGFRNIHGKPCFLGYRPIGDIPSKLLSSINQNKEAMLKPKGNYSEWQSFIRKYIVPNIELSLALILGATAPVSHILKEHGEFPSLAVWALVNSTSRGKSTSLYLISSLFFSPRHSIENFNATENALYALLEERGAYPLLCDEATHTPSIDWDSLLYTLPTGKERRRCDNKGKLKPLVEFSGAIIMTSETSILDRSQGYGGQECRILEFNMNPFDGNPRLAETIRNFCFQHYGWATEPLITLLLNEEEQAKLVARYQQSCERLLKKAPFEITGVERRLIQLCALILTSGYVLRKAIKCNLDLASIERYLIAHITSKVESRDNRDLADKILDKITGFVCTNQDKFPTVASLSTQATHKHYGAFWGATGFYGSKACVWIQEHILAERIIATEMKTKNTTLKALCDKKLLIKFYDKRYTIQKDFGKVRSNYYCFVLPDNPSLIRKFDDHSNTKPSVATLSARLAEDYDIKDFENNNAERNIPYLAISHGGNNSYAIFASEPFRKLMSMTSKSTLYATYFSDDKALVLTKSTFAVNSIPLRFDKESNGIVAKGISVNNLLDKIAMNIPLNHRLVMTEFSVDEYRGQPAAVVNLQEDSLSIEPVENPPVDFHIPHFKNDGVRYSKVNSLLNDDPNEDN